MDTNSEFSTAICAMRVSPSPDNGEGDIDAFAMTCWRGPFGLPLSSLPGGA